MSLEVINLITEPSEPMPGEGHIGVNSVMAVPERQISSYSCRVMRFAKGGSTSIHSHERVHVVAVLKGRIEILTNHEKHIMTPDVMIIVPSNIPHRFINLEDEASVILVQNLHS
jgi:quercetin dioxygenase-like cupin family protein